MVKIFKPAFVDAIQASYFNYNNGLKIAMFNGVKKALGDVVLSCRLTTVSDVQTQTLVQTKAVEDRILKSILSQPVLIVPIAVIAGKMVQKAVDEYSLRDMKEASTEVADDRQSRTRLLPCATNVLKIRSEPESHDKPCCSRCYGCTTSCPSHHDKWVSKGHYSISDASFDRVSRHRSHCSLHLIYPCPHSRPH